MFIPRSSRILLFATLAIVVGSVPGIGQMDWKRLSPNTSPAVRISHTVTYDEARHRTVVFGGNNGTMRFNDTWEWDGSDWKKCTPRTSPPARHYHRMAYDGARRKLVLFGGQDPQFRQLNDTWEWDGSCALQGHMSDKHARVCPASVHGRMTTSWYKER